MVSMEELLTLGLGLLPYLFFIGVTVKTQVKNVQEKNWDNIIIWVLILVITQLAVFVIIQIGFEELTSLNKLNGYGKFAFAFGLGLFISGGYDSIKAIADSKKFKGEAFQAYQINTDEYNGKGNEKEPIIEEYSIGDIKPVMLEDPIPDGIPIVKKSEGITDQQLDELINDTLNGPKIVPTAPNDILEHEIKDISVIFILKDGEMIIVPRSRFVEYNRSFDMFEIREMLGYEETIAEIKEENIYDIYLQVYNEDKNKIRFSPCIDNGKMNRVFMENLQPIYDKKYSFKEIDDIAISLFPENNIKSNEH